MKTNSKNPVGKELADTISDRSQLYKKVTVKYDKWWHKILALLYIKPRTKDIVLSELFPSTVYRLLAILIDLRVKGEKGDTEELNMYRILHSNIPLLNEFIAIAVHNSKDEPPQWLIDAINYQMTSTDLDYLINDIYRRLDVEVFFGILTSLRRMQELSHTLDPEVHTHS